MSGVLESPWILLNRYSGNPESSHSAFVSHVAMEMDCFLSDVLGRVKRKNARKAAGGGGDDDED